MYGIMVPYTNNNLKMIFFLLFLQECQPQNVYKGNHWTSTAASESARLADGIYQVPLDIEDEPTPSVSRHVPRGCPNNTSRPQRPPKRRHRSSSSNNNRLSNTNTLMYRIADQIYY